MRDGVIGGTAHGRSGGGVRFGTKAGSEQAEHTPPFLSSHTPVSC